MLIRRILAVLLGVPLVIAVSGCATTNRTTIKNATIENATIKDSTISNSVISNSAVKNDARGKAPKSATEKSAYNEPPLGSDFEERVAQVQAQCNLSPAGAQAIVKMDYLDLDKGMRYEDVVRMFGEPRDLEHGGAQYAWGFVFGFKEGLAQQVSFYAPFYAYGGKIRVSSTVDEVEAFFKPIRVVEGYSARMDDCVLYKDRDGIKGLWHYDNKELGLRIGGTQNVVTSISLNRRDTFH